MGLVISDPIRVEVPHEDGEWFDLVKIGWRDMKVARKAQESEQREVLKQLGADFMRALTDKEKTDDEAAVALRRLEAQQYRESNYDRMMLLCKGVVGWSYDAPVNENTISQLDEATAAWAAQAIIDLVKPETEDERKNG